MRRGVLSIEPSAIRRNPAEDEAFSTTSNMIERPPGMKRRERSYPPGAAHHSILPHFGLGKSGAFALCFSAGKMPTIWRPATGRRPGIGIDCFPGDVAPQRAGGLGDLVANLLAIDLAYLLDRPWTICRQA